MRYDHTRIVIRERDLWEVVDLALEVIRQYGLPLLWTTGTLLLPLTLFNWWVLSSLVMYEQNSEYLIRYTLAMASLMAIQVPLSTAVGTLYLGRLMFYDKWTLLQLWQEIGSLSGRLFWAIGVRRLVIPAWVIAFWIDPSQSYSTAEVWLLFLGSFAVVLNAASPFVTEVIVLEQSPFWFSSGQSVSFSKRMRQMRSFGSSEALTRMLTLSIPYTILAFGMAGSLWYLLRVVLGTSRFDMLAFSVAWAVSLMLIEIYTLVVRYLSYLDLRIRREGWEVFLQLRAATVSLTEAHL